MSKSDLAISVRGLGKSYTIAHDSSEKHATLAEMMLHRLRNPLRRRTTETFWALRDVAFDIKKGDVVGIIGRNGAGKSTLLKILSRITEPTTGEIDVYGRIGSLLEVGTGFHPELTGRENIFLNGAILGMSKAEIRKQFDAIVDFSGVVQFLDTPVKRYSSGMYVRLAFAVAAHLESETLIVDEVLAVGDAEFQNKCMGKMRDVATGGRTVIFVSHNMQAVQSLCNRGVLLSQGRVAAVGDAATVTSTYLQQADLHPGHVWRRENRPTDQDAFFERIECQLSGTQPNLTLDVDMTITSSRGHPDAFIAIDISDSLGAVIMQALPTLNGFIHAESRTAAVRVQVDLPPLVPGTYSLSLWMGPHNNETLDSVVNCVKFDVSESPTPGRTFPHTRDHGHVVPMSRVLIPSFV